MEKRFAWLRQCLIEFEERYSALFPAAWAMSERIALQFSDITRQQLGSLMRTRHDEIDVKLFLFAAQKVLKFEEFLVRRFGSGSLQRDWKGIVSRSFEDNIDIYIKAQDKCVSLPSAFNSSSLHLLN